MYYIIEFKYYSVTLSEEVMTIDVYRTEEERDKGVEKVLENPRFKKVTVHNMNPWQLTLFVSDNEPFNISFH